MIGSAISCTWIIKTYVIKVDHPCYKMGFSDISINTVNIEGERERVILTAMIFLRYIGFIIYNYKTSNALAEE